jgi:hypothetical protein
VSTKDYIVGRQKFLSEKGGTMYGRPQALLFSNNQGTVDNGYFVPDGDEFTDFIVLSDHNRWRICSVLGAVQSLSRYSVNLRSIGSPAIY